MDPQQKKPLFNDLISATFLKRLNRFTVLCQLENGEIHRAYLPNPGRLWELLLPETTVLLENENKKHRSLKYTIVAARKNNHTIMLHTHKTNDLAEMLLLEKCIPGLEKTSIIKREYTHGNSRFDFKLHQNNIDVLLEVKSCTLIHGPMAMFPDAITERGTRHVVELSQLASEKVQTAILFLIQSAEVDAFLPDYHTDIIFARTLYEKRKLLRIIPFCVAWSDDLKPILPGREITIPWKIFEKEGKDSGYLLTIARFDSEQTPPPEISEKKPPALMAKGFYMTLSGPLDNLGQEEKKLKLVRKKNPPLNLFLRQASTRFTVIPIRTEDRITELLSQTIQSLADHQTILADEPGNQQRISYCSQDPLTNPKFVDALLNIRMLRPLQKKTTEQHSHNQRQG